MTQRKTGGVHRRAAAPPSYREVLRDLYKTMLSIRRVEERAIEIYPSDKIQSPMHLSTGQEAVSAGVCRAMDRQDHIYGTYRGHGLYIARGGDLNKFFAELYAKDTGFAHGKGGSMHLAAPEVGLMGCSAIVASTIPIAVGDALAAKMRGERRVVVSFFGDGAVDEGVFFESVNFALLKKLPILFVLENNGYAIHSRVADRHTRTDLFRIGEGMGLKGTRYDGNDVFTVYESARRAMKDLRKGGTPRLVEYTTFRWQEHVGPGMDFDAQYRRPGEERMARQNDPLKKTRAVLKRKFKVPAGEFQQWEADLREKIENAVTFAERSSFPPVERLFQDVFK